MTTILICILLLYLTDVIIQPPYNMYRDEFNMWVILHSFLATCWLIYFGLTVWVINFLTHWAIDSLEVFVKCRGVGGRKKHCEMMLSTGDFVLHLVIMLITIKEFV